MSRIHAIETRRAIVNRELVEDLEEALTRARSGEVTGYALVTLTADGTINRASLLERRLELLGALATAMDHVHRT